jgi:hypothetical protein
MIRLPRGFLSILLALAFVGCATSYYDTYREQHSGWHPDFPREDVGLPETIASVLAPVPSGGRTPTRRFEIFQTNASPWREFRDAQVDEVDQTEDYLVVVYSGCSYQDGTYYYSNSFNAWYYLLGGKLTAYSHFHPSGRCRITPEAAGDDLLPLPVRHYLERKGLLISELPPE